MRSNEVPLQVLRNVIVVTVQTDLNVSFLERMNEVVLTKVQEAKLRWVILDLSGMDVIDDDELKQLTKIRDKLKLMGTGTIFAGLKPHVIVALDPLGTDFTGLKAARDLDQALLLTSTREPRAAGKAT